MRIVSSLLLVGITLGGLARVEAAPTAKKVVVQKTNLRRVMRVAASVAPRLWASLSAPAGGMVTEVFNDLGDHVKRGQRLAMVQAAHGGKPTAMLAPFSGVIIGRNAQPGVFTPDGVGLFTLIDDSVVRIELDVPEADAAMLFAGAPLSVRFNALPNRVYQAKVKLVVPWVDPRTHSLHADTEVENSDRQLISGMIGEAAIEVASRTGALAVPRAAVLLEGNQPFVLRVDGDRARRVGVTLGIEDGDSVEVVAGLAAGDVVLVGGALHDGDSVPR